MIFKNITLMKVSEREVELPAQTVRFPAQRGIGPCERISVGLAPIHDGGCPASLETFCHDVGKCTLFRLSKQERKIPSSVLKAALRERIEAYRERMGRTPGKRARDQLKDEALAELLPKAFVHETFYTAYIDWEIDMLVVNTASDNVAEMVADQLREVFSPRYDIAPPVATEQSVSGLMTEWVRSGKLPDGFTNGDDADMKDPLDTRMQVKVRHHDLSMSEVVDHVHSGKRVTQLALNYDGRITFVLDENAQLRKVKFTDVSNEELHASMGDEADKRADFDAAMTFMTLEFRRLIRALHGVLGFQ